MKTEQQIRVNRFRNQVSLSGESMSTEIYMSPEMALKLAGELLNYAINCQSTTYGKSTLNGKTLNEVVDSDGKVVIV